MAKKIRAPSESGLVDYLLLKNKLAPALRAIVSEVPFLKGRRRIDILKIDARELVAFEIKSKTDSLKRLVGQVEDYVDAFDRTYLVFSESKRQGIAKLGLGFRLGLIGYDEHTGKFEVIWVAKKTLR